MVTSLCSAVVLAALLQAPEPAVPVDSITAARERVGHDSTDRGGWLSVGRTFLGLADRAPVGGGGVRSSADSGWARAALDTAEAALLRAMALAPPSEGDALGDSARVLRVGVWAARSRLAWESQGTATGVEVWGPLPADLRIPAVLEELGENLLRACPMGGVLITSGDADGYAAWYMRWARGLRPDVLVVPLAAWRDEPLLRARLALDLKLRRRGTDAAWLGEVARRRAVCVSMAFERPPDVRPRIAWVPRGLVWVAGPEGKSPRVPARDFVFAALRLGLDAHDPWTEPARTAYVRAARATPALCEAIGTFKVASEVASCRR